MEGYHSSVLLEESVDALRVEQGKQYLDCTLGDGGHTIEILKRGGKVIGIDVDGGYKEDQKKTGRIRVFREGNISPE